MSSGIIEQDKSEWIESKKETIANQEDFEGVWRENYEQCDECGGASEVYTRVNNTEGWVNDGDPVICIECGNIGYWSVFDTDDMYVNWDEETFILKGE